jgi:hypothetical protein
LLTAVALINSSIPPSNGMPGNRHQARLHAARLLGGYIAGGILSYEQAYAALEAAVARNTDNFEAAMKTVRDGPTHGQQFPITPQKIVADRRAWLAADGHPSDHTTPPSDLDADVDEELDDDDAKAEAERKRREESEAFRKAHPLAWLKSRHYCLTLKEVPLAGLLAIVSL